MVTIVKKEKKIPYHYMSVSCFFVVFLHYSGYIVRKD